MVITHNYKRVLKGKSLPHCVIGALGNVIDNLRFSHRPT